MNLGVRGYTFDDLHDPKRLASLYERFCEEVESADPALWRQWDAYRQAPDAPLPLALSNLLIDMAPHVSRFLRRLFDVDGPAEALNSATQAQDDLFRFKVDFVRRRVLPMLKSGATVTRTAEDDAVVEQLIAAQNTDDRELALARAGCAILDAERAPGTSAPGTPAPGTPAPAPGTSAPAPSTQHPAPGTQPGAAALKRWCAARVHDRAYRHWVVFRFPETLDYW